MNEEQFVDMIDVALTSFEKDSDVNAILVNFCLTCGLHEDCMNTTCDMQHCNGHTVTCTLDECVCDRTQLSECQYMNILNGTEKRYNGRHLMKLSPGIAMWCKKCHSHLNCGFKQCLRDHCVC